MDGARKTLKRGFALLDRDKARKEAPVAVKALRRISKAARADLSVNEIQCNRLDHALDLVEEELNDILPPPDSPPKAKLPAEWLEDAGEDGDVPGDVDTGK